MMRVGIVGCGWVAEKHIGFIKHMTNAEIVAIADENAAARDRISEKYGLESQYASQRELLSDSEVDVVHILTPPFSHKSLSLEAVRNGKHVYIEKPIALNYAEVKDIYEAAHKNGIKVCPGYNYLFDPIVSEAIDIVESPDFGKIVYVESFYGMNMRRYDRLKTNRENEIHWSYDLPGGFHQNYITHPLYMCLRFTGKVKEMHVVTDVTGAIPQNLTDEIRVLIKGESALGLLVQSYSCEPYQHFLNIYGEKKAIKIDWRNISVINYRKHRLPDAINRVLLNNLDLCWQHGKSSVSNVFGFATKKAIPYHGMKLLIERFYDSIESGTDSPVSDDLVHATESTSDSIYKEIPHKHLDFTIRRPANQLLESKGTILVTGASGFVGKEVVKRLLAEGYQVRAFVRKLSYINELEGMGVEIYFGDIRHFKSFQNAVEGIEIIIHLAAALGVPAGEYMEITVGGVENLIRIVNERSIKKVIYMSSMSVYDLADCSENTKITENHIYERRPLDRGAYTASKLEAEKLVRKEMETSQASWTILRPSMIIGRHSKVFLNPLGISLGKLRLIFGLGYDHLRLIPVEDVADVITECVESEKCNGRIYNLNHDDRISKRQYLKQVVGPTSGKGINLYLPHWIMISLIYMQEKIFKLVRRKPPLTRYRYRSAQRKVCFDTERIKSELGWKPRMALDEFFRANYLGTLDENAKK